MDIHAEERSDSLLLAFAGELDIYSVTEVNEALLDALIKGQRIEVDLGDVEAVDGAGLQMLMAAKLEAIRLGKELVLSHHNAAVVEAIELAQLSAFFGDPVVLRAEGRKA